MTRRIILVDIGTGLSMRGVLPSVALLADYSASLIASGGQAPYSYSLAAGTLPDGLVLDAATGTISGTASTAGQAVFTVRVTDLSGAHVDRQFAITVIAEPLSLSGAAPAWTVGTPYSYSYTAAHGVPPYTWSISAGSLPAGLSLDSTGTVSGTPTAPNAPAWTVRVTDSASAQIDLRDNVTLQLLGDFADATAGAAYTSDIPINGGDLPYSNPRVTVGSLVGTGLALSIVGDKLRLSGTAPPVTTVNITVAADSADGQTATSVQSVEVTDATITPAIGVNVALHKSVSVSSPLSWNGIPDLAVVVDGDVSSINRYVNPTAGGTQWVQVDLGAKYMISQVKVWHYYADGRKYHNNRTEVSVDGAAWTTIYDSAVSGEFSESLSGQTIGFSLRAVRYVRNSTNGSTANNGSHWIEIQASRAS
ncbi:MAG: putative Ig domain-containing protein [Rhodanobacter sp.]